MSDHDDVHDPAETFQQRLLTVAENREREIQVKAIEALLVEKNLVSDELLDTVLDSYENDIGPLNGCRVVARAWTDPAYKARLLENGTAAIAELGFGGLQGEHLAVVENTPETHNVIVCALCSCYPGRSWACRHSGIRASRIAPESPAGLVRCSRNLGLNSPKTSGFRSGTVTSRLAIWSCRSAHSVRSR